MEKQKGSKGKFCLAEKHWSEAMCINHWSMAISIVILIVTGFYIALPFNIAVGETYQKFFVANVRFVHLVFGLLLTAILVWRFYLALFSKFHADWKDFFAWLNIKKTIHAIKFYTLITTDPPEHTGLYGTLQAAAYLVLLLMAFFEVVTGLILYGALHRAGLAGFLYSLLGPIERNIFSGLAGTRYIHHILTWFFVLFIIIHTYLSFWYDVVFKEGTISSIVNGLFFKKAEEHEFKEG